MKFFALIICVVIMTALLVSGCISSTEEEIEEQDEVDIPRIEAVVIENEDVIELYPIPSVVLDPWELMFYCGSTPCDNTIQTVRVINNTQSPVTVYEPVINHTEGSGQVLGSFTIISPTEWNAILNSGEEIEIQIKFSWLVYQQSALLIIPVDNELLECSLSGKLFSF